MSGRPRRLVHRHVSEMRGVGRSRRAARCAASRAGTHRPSRACRRSPGVSTTSSARPPAGVRSTTWAVGPRRRNTNGRRAPSTTMAISVSSSQRSSRSLWNPWKSSPSRYSSAATPVQRTGYRDSRCRAVCRSSGSASSRRACGQPLLGHVALVAQDLGLLPRRVVVEPAELLVGVGHEAVDDVDPRAGVEVEPANRRPPVDRQCGGGRHVRGRRRHDRAPIRSAARRRPSVASSSENVVTSARTMP